MGNPEGENYTRSVDNAVDDNAAAVTAPVDQAVTASGQVLGESAQSPQSQPEPRAINIVKVTPTPPAVEQPNIEVCWAVAAAVMIGWARGHVAVFHHQQYVLDILYTIDTETGKSNDGWARRYLNGMSQSTLAPFVADLNASAQALGIGNRRLVSIGSMSDEQGAPWRTVRQTLADNRPVMLADLVHAVVLCGYFTSVDHEGGTVEYYGVVNFGKYQNAEREGMEKVTGYFYTWQ